MISESDILRELVERGLPLHAARGVAMNLRDESGLDPGISEIAPVVPGSRGGYGLAQWTGPRRVALEDYAAARGVSAADPDLQLDFLMHELNGPERNALTSLLAAGSPGEAAAAFVRDFERPAPEHLARRTAAYLGSGQDTNALAAFAAPEPTQPAGNALAAILEQRMASLDGGNALSAFRPQAQTLDPQMFMNRRSFA